MTKRYDFPDPLDEKEATMGAAIKLSTMINHVRCMEDVAFLVFPKC